MISMIRILPLAALLLAGSADATLAQDAPPKPIGQFLSVRSPIDDSVIGRVRKVAQDLAIRTEKESRPAVLVLSLIHI